MEHLLNEYTTGAEAVNNELSELRAALKAPAGIDWETGAVVEGEWILVKMKSITGTFVGIGIVYDGVLSWHELDETEAQNTTVEADARWVRLSDLTGMIGGGE